MIKRTLGKNIKHLIVQSTVGNRSTVVENTETFRISLHYLAVQSFTKNFLQTSLALLGIDIS